MSTLDAQIEREIAGNGSAEGTEPDDEQAKIEERRAKDRERKRRERAGGAPKRKPGRPRSASKAEKAEESADSELDPRVVTAVKMCMAAMLEPNITPEFVQAMNVALHGALSYELEERLPLLADGYEPEVGLGCAIIGAGVTRFRHERWKKRNTVTATEVTPEPEQPAAETEPTA